MKITKKPLTIVILTVAASAFVALPRLSATLLIDSFTTGTNSVTNAAAGNVSDRQGTLTGLLDNGYRAVVVRNFGGNQGSGNSANVSGGLFNAVRGPGPDPSDFVLEYTGEEFIVNGAWNYTGLAGMTQMQFDLTSNTNAAIQIAITAAKWDSGFASYTTSPTVSAYAPVGASSVFIDITPMNLGTFGGIDLLEIRFAYNPDPYNFSDTINQSFSITEIVAIPEPSTLALLGLVVLGLIARGRRA